MNELFLGNVATGHNVAIGDAMFGIMDSGHKLTLVTAATGELAKFSGNAPHVFITVNDLVLDEYHPRLTGKWGDQQVAMQKHIRQTVGNDVLDALKARMNGDREARQEAQLSNMPPAFTIDENLALWQSSSKDIAAAFAAMSDEKPAEIQIFNEAAYGISLGFFYGTHSGRTDGIMIEIGHVGKKSELAGQIGLRTGLWCFRGMLPETLSENALKTANGSSIQKFYDFMMGLDFKVRGPILDGMHSAFERIRKEPKKPVAAATVTPIKKGIAKLASVPTPDSAPAQEEVVPVLELTVQQVPQVVTQVADAKPQDEGLRAFMSGMKSEGATDREIGMAITAFMAMNKADTMSA